MSKSFTMETNHNVYILGAGFSFDAGIPLVYDFLNFMRDSLGWLENNGRDAEAQAVKNVFDFRKQASAATERINLNLENIEELFSLASASEGTTLAGNVLI